LQRKGQRSETLTGKKGNTPRGGTKSGKSKRAEGRGGPWGKSKNISVSIG